MVMLNIGYFNGGNNSVLAVLGHRRTRLITAWLAFFLTGLSLWYFVRNSSIATIRPPTQSSMCIHKTQEEIGVLPWPEERWFEGPRNESQLEKAALIMLVR